MSGDATVAAVIEPSCWTGIYEGALLPIYDNVIVPIGTTFEQWGAAISETAVKVWEATKDFFANLGNVLAKEWDKFVEILKDNQTCVIAAVASFLGGALIAIICAIFWCRATEENRIIAENKAKFEADHPVPNPADVARNYRTVDGDVDILRRGRMAVRGDGDAWSVPGTPVHAGEAPLSDRARDAQIEDMRRFAANLPPVIDENAGLPDADVAGEPADAADAADGEASRAASSAAADVPPGSVDLLLRASAGAASAAAGSGSGSVDPVAAARARTLAASASLRPSAAAPVVGDDASRPLRRTRFAADAASSGPMGDAVADSLALTRRVQVSAGAGGDALFDASLGAPTRAPLAAADSSSSGPMSDALADGLAATVIAAAIGSAGNVMSALGDPSATALRASMAPRGRPHPQPLPAHSVDDSAIGGGRGRGAAPFLPRAPLMPLTQARAHGGPQAIFSPAQLQAAYANVIGLARSTDANGRGARALPALDASGRGAGVRLDPSRVSAASPDLMAGLPPTRSAQAAGALLRQHQHHHHHHVAAHNDRAVAHTARSGRAPSEDGHYSGDEFDDASAQASPTGAPMGRGPLGSLPRASAAAASAMMGQTAPVRQAPTVVRHASATAAGGPRGGAVSSGLPGAPSTLSSPGITPLAADAESGGDDGLSATALALGLPVGQTARPLQAQTARAVHSPHSGGASPSHGQASGVGDELFHALLSGSGSDARAPAPAATARGPAPTPAARTGQPALPPLPANRGSAAAPLAAVVEQLPPPPPADDRSSPAAAGVANPLPQQLPAGGDRSAAVSPQTVAAGAAGASAPLPVPVAVLTPRSAAASAAAAAASAAAAADGSAPAL